MESLFCIAALILIGYLMIAPFFPPSEKHGFRWYCVLIVIYLFSSGTSSAAGKGTECPPYGKCPSPRRRYLARGCASLYTSFIRSALTWV